jgi:hypothetical protein
MKTSIVAVIAASLFLAAAYLGLGSRPGAPPGPPEMIAIAGPSSDAGTPAAADLPLTLPSSPAASQVLAVGRQVVPGSLKDLAARIPRSGGPVDTAAGPAAGSGQFNPTVNTDVQPLPRSVPGATSPPVNVANPGPVPLPIPTPVIFPTHRPRPEPSPTPQPPAPKPTPTPTPTPTAVTPTVTPPVTSTANSTSPTPSPHP